MTCVPRLQDSAKKAKHKAASGDTPDDQNAETKVDLSFTHSRSPRP
jgi:hypothetical protein